MFDRTTGSNPFLELDEQVFLRSLQRRLFEDNPAPVRVGRYDLQERLGSGGMGTVYRARDPKLCRDVALKLLHGTQKQHQADAVLQEAQGLATLNHPNVVRVFDVGATLGEGGTCVYLVMELIDGVGAKAWAAQPGRSPREIRQACAALGRGLQAAHDAGLVHSDVKPSNVLVDARGPHLADFGVSIPLPVTGSSPRSPSPRRLFRGGTRGYMPPEQAQQGSVHPRGDQYAFCVTVWELLEGTHPTPGRAGGSQTPPTRIRPRLAKVLARGMHANPEDRWPSLHPILSALELGATTRWYWLGATGLTLGLLLVFITMSAANTDATQAPTPCAVLRDRTALEPPARQRAWETALDSACPLEAGAATTQCFERMLAGETDALDPRECIYPPTPCPSEISGPEANRIDRLARAGKLEHARALARDALRRVGEESAALCRARGSLRLGMLEVAGGDPDAAAKHLETAISWAGTRTLEHSTVSAKAYSVLMQLVGRHLKDPDRAARWVQGATVLADGLPRDHPFRTDLLCERGGLAVVGGEPNAIDLSQACVRARSDAGAHVLELAEANMLLSAAYITHEAFLDARDAAQRSVDLHERGAGSTSPGLITPLLNLGIAASKLGDAHSGRSALRRSLRVAEGAFGADHLATIEPLLALSDLSLAQGDWAAARTGLGRALTNSRAGYGLAHVTTAEVECRLAGALLSGPTPHLERASSLIQTSWDLLLQHPTGLASGSLEACARTRRRAENLMLVPAGSTLAEDTSHLPPGPTKSRLLAILSEPPA